MVIVNNITRVDPQRSDPHTHTHTQTILDKVNENEQQQEGQVGGRCKSVQGIEGQIFKRHSHNKNERLVPVRLGWSCQ
jgi:hypothetical protein